MVESLKTPNTIQWREKTLASGIDFLGWIHFPDHLVLRTTTKRRMFKKLKESPTSEILNSYLGLLKWGNTEKLKDRIITFDASDKNGRNDLQS